MQVLVTGVSGYVGAALVPRLRAEGHRVRGYGRSAARVTAALDEFVEGDAILGAGLDRALDGVEVAYYLIHSMEGAGNGFADHERRARRAASPPPPPTPGCGGSSTSAGSSRATARSRATSPRGWRSRSCCWPPRRSRSRCAPRS